MTCDKKSVRRGEMKLGIPKDGKCHPVVGRTYQEQCDHQLNIVTDVLTGGKGCLPELPRDKFPEPAFWDELRGKEAKTSQSISGNKKKQISDEAVPVSQPTLFELMLAVVPVGHEVVAILWSIDTLAVGRLASASKTCSDAVAIYVSRFHLPLGDYQDCDWLPDALDGIDDTRRSTIGIGRNLFVRGRDRSIVPGAIKGIPKAWLSHETRNTLWNIAQENKADADTYEKFFPFLVNHHRLLHAEVRLSAAHREQNVPLAEVTSHHLREISYNVPLCTSVEYLMKNDANEATVRSLSQYGGALKALRLYEVPMMDLRIIEMILMTCPKLEIMGIIKCELLHVGHINDILDLVHWNSKRVAKKPMNLQFYPRAYSNQRNNCIGTHAVSWDPLNVNVLTGIFATVFLAVMKALPMGIDLLSKDQEFRRFFDLVPMKPGQGAVFLHHLFTWIDAATSPPSYVLLPDDVKEDLEDQVVMSLLMGCDQKMKRRQRREHFQKHTCSRCSNTFIRPFFRPEMDTRRLAYWVCRICDLHYALNGETHHRLTEKRDLLDTFLSAPDRDVRRPGRFMYQELQDAVAPLLVNPFARSPALESVARIEAVQNHHSLPQVQDLIAPERDYIVLRVSGEAALLDVVDRMKELQGIYMDHPTLTEQAVPEWARINKKRARNQSWEYVLWKNSVKDTKEHQASRFW
ncbi:hypothetical protein ColKHC_11807 [Colletotrichum higginsianum]|nr:hypothetical protein ColKHC_11807 [Colletotrichum higginsianum]